VANAILVERVRAAVGNAVLVQSVKTVATAPVGNAVLVQSLKAVTNGTAPVADAGPDQYTAEPWSTVTLTGAASSGTGLSYAWSQTAGTAVTLTGTGATRTFVAPSPAAGGTFTFSLTVTDSAGLISAADAVAVVVLPVTEFARVAGAWVPRRPLKRSGAAWV